MKKIIFLLVAIYLLATPLVTLAEVTTYGAGGTIGETLYSVATESGYEKVEDSSLALNVARLFEILLSVLGIIFLIITIYAGFRWMTAGGNEEQITASKQLLKNAVIGLAIIFSSLAITRFVGSGLTYSAFQEYK
jgi:hypothetical protein